MSYLPHYQWAILLFCSLVYFCLSFVRPKFGTAAAALIGYLGCNAVWQWVWVHNRYFPLNPYDQMAIRYFAADSLCRLLIVILPLMLLTKRNLEVYGKMGVEVFVYVNSLLVLAQFLIHRCAVDNSCGGLGNPSIIVGASVCALPVISKDLKNSWPIILLVGLAVLASKSSVALGLFAAFLLFSFMGRFTVLAIAASIAPLIVGYFILGKEVLFSSSDRFMLWEYMMERWNVWWNYAYGTGFGTYHVMSINLQNCEELARNAGLVMQEMTGCGTVAPGSHWNAMHNDWLQMIFEGGIVGAFLMVATYLTALYKVVCEGRWELAVSIILFGLYLGVNPGLHHALPALFGAWLFVHALRQPTRGACLCLA